MKYDYCVVIGRFQPLHKGHLELFLKARSLAPNTIVLLGSATSARTSKNPFTAEERRAMIHRAYHEEGVGSRAPVVLNLRDFYYSDNLWAAEVQRLVYSVAPHGAKICLVGGTKNDTYYLQMFPQWSLETIVPSQDDATAVREQIFQGPGNAMAVTMRVPNGVMQIVAPFMDGQQYQRLKEEWEYYKKYPEVWGDGPHVTVDSVVTCGGHILLVQRGECPGKGLWALPGGFLGLNERLEDGALRELKEETCIKVPAPVLRGNIVSSRVFDHPFRSARGRVITHAYHIDLKEKELPKVKGKSDAMHAEWKPLSWVLSNPNMMFEDHNAIIECMIAGA